MKNTVLVTFLLLVLGCVFYLNIADEEVSENGTQKKHIEVNKTSKVFDKKTNLDLDAYVTPPDEYGNPGLTLREVEEIAKNQAKVDPNTIYVTPPDEDGNPGATLAEVEKIIKENKNLN